MNAQKIKKNHSGLNFNPDFFERRSNQLSGEKRKGGKFSRLKRNQLSPR